MSVRGVAGLVLLAALTGCDWGGLEPAAPQARPPDGAPPFPGGLFGPVLVLDVVNNSNEDVVAGYEYESDNPTGSGESIIPACHHVSTFFAEIAGTYRVLIDGVVVAEDAVPRAMSDGAVTKRVVIAPDGTAHAAGGLPWTESVPGDFTRRIGDCP